MFTDYTFGHVFVFLENEEITNLMSVSKGWYALTSEYLKNWRVLDCGKNQEVAIQMSDLRYKVKLDLRGTRVKDVSALGNVHALDLSWAGVRNVSMLGNVHTLYLSYTKVTDASMLGNVHTLNLSWTKVTDVSALGNVHTLDLSYTKVTDVSMLGKVHTLDLSDTKVTDVSALVKVHTLCLYETQVADVSYFRFEIYRSDGCFSFGKRAYLRFEFYAS